MAAPDRRMVDIDEKYLSEKIKKSGYQKQLLSLELGYNNEASLRSSLCRGRIRMYQLEGLCKLIHADVDRAVISKKKEVTKAYIKQPITSDVKTKLDEVLDLQKQLDMKLLEITKIVYSRENAIGG
jgi:hypothetical protein